MGYFLDEPGRQELLHLLADGPVLLLVESAQALLHWSGAGSDVQGVLGDLPRYARHVRGTPCEHIGIRAKKVDEHDFLFVVEGGADPQRSAVGAGGVNRDEFDGPNGLKSPGTTLGVGHFATELVEVDDEGLGLHDSLSVLDAFDVAVVCMLVRGLDGEIRCRCCPPIGRCPVGLHRLPYRALPMVERVCVSPLLIG